MLNSCKTEVSMKKILLLALMTSNLIASEVILTEKEIDLGLLSNEDNSQISKIITLKRNSESPKVVSLKYKLNYLIEECVDFEVKVEEIPETSSVVCEKTNGDAFACDTKVFSGLYNAKTVCAKKGLVQKVQENEVKVSFKKAVVLAPEASETFQVQLNQANIKSSKVEAIGQVIQSHSLYKVKTGFGGSINFKAL